MNTETVTITHGTDGIRIAWPNGTCSVFSNSIYLAEAFARSMQAKESARQTLISDAAELLNQGDEIADGTMGKILTALRGVLCEAAKTLA